MDAHTLGEAYANGDRLLFGDSDIRAQTTPSITFSKVCADLRYVPKRFPTHQDFLRTHDFYHWLQTTLRH